MKLRKFPDWQEVNEKIEQLFPEVAHIDLDQYFIHFANSKAHVLIDVREKDEYDVSHLPGAVNINNVDELVSLAQTSNKTLIIYCSVGYRSANTVRDLLESDVTCVVNLKGSIFSWANSGLPLFNSKGRTKTVHPFNQR